MANTENAARPGPSRGIYEDDVVPAGEKWFKLVTSTGRVGTVHLPAEMAEEGTGVVTYLWNLLDRMDPESPRHLQVIPPSSRPRKSRGKSAPPTLTIARGGE